MGEHPMGASSSESASAGSRRSSSTSG
jgi:hypothetical protein